MQNYSKTETVLIIDDNEDDFKIISRYISNSYHIIYLSDVSDIIVNIIKNEPDCILLDYHLGIDKGISLLKELKKNEDIHDIPIIMLTGETNPDVIIQCMKNNADDYLIKGDYDKTRLNLAIEQSIEKAVLKKQIKDQQKQILQLSRTDVLTGTYNRGYLIQRINDDILRLKRSKSHLSITIVDLDNFKKVNDVHGHSAGDSVLKEMAVVIKKGIRVTDYIGRYGGDEFIIVLLDFEKRPTVEIIENHGKIINKIRKELSNIQVAYDDMESSDKTIQFTATFGMTLCDVSTISFKQLLLNADKALYTAKEDGRNCTAIYYSENNIKILPN